MTGKHHAFDIHTIIARCDRLAAAGKTAELGSFLRTSRSKASENGDAGLELSILNELIGHCRMTGDRQQGTAAIRDAMLLISTLPDTDPLTVSTIKLNVATALHAFGKIDDSLKLFAEVRECYTTLLSPDDPRLAGVFNNMAPALADAGDFAGAEDCYFRALEVLRTPENLLDRAVSCINLVQLYHREQKNIQLTGKLLKHAMECFDDPAVPRDGYYAHSCAKCAPVFGDSGYPELQAELEKRMREIHAGN